tara:strand:+ start:5085 stop:5459 length:375 start_codon:yes stop_codon:yes gene_type:complete
MKSFSQFINEDKIDEGVGLTVARAIDKTNPPLGRPSKRRAVSHALKMREIMRDTEKNKKRKFSGKAAPDVKEDVARDKQGNDKFDRYKRMVRHKQDKYGVSTLKQRLKHGGVDYNIDNEKRAKK